MPVVVNPKDSKMRIRFNTGVDTDGKEILKTKTFSRIKSEAQDEDVIAVANELIGLQEYSAANIVRVDERELSEVE